MPTYEYKCRSCEHDFEIQQSMSEDALTVCPECGGELRKVFHPVGIAFKGSGFYKNDARADSGGGSGSSSSSTSSNGDGAGSSGESTSKDKGSSDSTSSDASSSTSDTDSKSSSKDGSKKSRSGAAQD